MNLHNASYLLWSPDYPFLSEVLVILLPTVSDTHLRHITPEFARSEHKPVRRLVRFPWQHHQYS